LEPHEKEANSASSYLDEAPSFFTERYLFKTKKQNPSIHAYCLDMKSRIHSVAIERNVQIGEEECSRHSA